MAPWNKKVAMWATGWGTYILTGGLLDGGPGNTAVGGLEIVGVSGTGTFNQSGGTNIASLGLYVGGSWTGSIQNLPTIGGSGVYTLSGGLLTTYAGGPNFEAIGQAGTGIFTQTGGTNLTATVTLSGNAQGTKPGNNAEYATPGTYNLQGGLLQTNSIVISPLFYDGGATNFNFSGGTLQEPSTGTFSSGVPITVGTNASNVATFDANGQTMSLNIGYQPLSGPGQLRVIDSLGGGKIVLGDSDDSNIANLYSGGTTVMSGTLQVLYTTALPSVGVLTVGGPVSIVSSVRAGTLFGSDAVGQTVVPEGDGRGNRNCHPGGRRSQFAYSRTGKRSEHGSVGKWPRAGPRAFDAGPFGRGHAKSACACSAAENRLRAGGQKHGVSFPSRLTSRQRARERVASLPSSISETKSLRGPLSPAGSSARGPPLSLALRRLAAFPRELFVWRPYLHIVRTRQPAAQAILDHTTQIGQGGVGVDKAGPCTDDRFRRRLSGGRSTDFPGVHIGPQQLDHVDQLGRASRGMEFEPT